MYVKHGELMRVTATKAISSNVDVCDSHSQFDGAQFDGEYDDEPPPAEYISERDRCTALFILKAREIHKISQSSMDHLLGDISSFFETMKDRLIQNVDSALREKGICMTDHLQAISHSPDVSDPFSGLHTEYLQKQYFIKHFNLVVSIATPYVCESVVVHFP
jgi:hypothetical protein